MLSRHRLQTIVFALLIAGPLAGEELPAAPEGFEWKRIDSVKAAVRMPKSWFYREEAEKDGTRGIFMSLENIDTAGEFETGLTINVTRLKKGNAQERALAFLALFAQTPGNELLGAREKEMGVLKGIRGRIRRTEKNRAPVLMEVFSIGNSRTNAVYLFVFESPEARWDDAWKLGEVMLGDLRLNTEF